MEITSEMIPSQYLMGMAKSGMTMEIYFVDILKKINLKVKENT